MADAETRVRNALSYLSPNCPREEWVYIGMGVHDELGEAGWPIFDEWSAGGDSYKAATARDVWKSFKQGGGKGFGYVVNLAKREGFDAAVKGYTKPTPEQVAEREAKHAERQKVHAAEEEVEEAAAAIRANERWDAAKPATDDHPYLKKKGVKAHGLKVGRWFKMDHTTGIRLELHNVLYLPLKDAEGKIRSLQGITAEGDKIYLSGGSKKGNFLPVGKPTNNAQGERIYGFAEGFATAASAHELTGITVVCCFDVGNMERLVRLMRERRPGSELIIFADNDTKTAERGKGNPGMEAAFKVGKECKATVVVNPHGGDFNDLVLEHGAEAAQAAFAARSVPTAAYKAPKPPAPPPVRVELDMGEQPLFHQYFEMLGYNHPHYFMYDRRLKQIVEFTARDITEGFLYEHAPREFWEQNYSVTREGGGKFDKVVAAEDILSRARARSIYSLDKVRGHGVWRDAGRVVFHHGDILSVDGQKVEVDQIRSSYVYPMRTAKPHPAAEPLTQEQGRALYKTAQLMRWVKPGSAALLLGWIFLSPICGALAWRPHLWLTGPAGSGKSFIQSHFINALIAGLGESFDGTSTEPGIRRQIGSGAVPVAIDEFEPNDQNARARIEPILTLVRQSSSESTSVIAKGSANGSVETFHVRSMFLLSSINSLLSKDSDSSRITQIALKSPTDAGEDNWPALQEALHAIEVDPTLKTRLLRRAMDAIPLIDKHYRTFTKIGAAKFEGSQRHGDQFGMLLCGFWFLHNDAEPTEENVQKLFDRLDWKDHQEAGPSDHVAAMNVIMNKTIHINSDFGRITVYELLLDAYRELKNKSAANATKYGATIARDVLARNGIKILVEKDGSEWVVMVPSHDAIKDMLKGLPAWSDVRATLKRVPGSTTFDGKTKRVMGNVTRVVGVPLQPLIGEEDSEEDSPL